jgi:hypothetical protein
MEVEMAPERAGAATGARVKVIHGAARFFINDGWLALTLFGAVLLVLVFQR